jgi:hypothetical protein
VPVPLPKLIGFCRVTHPPLDKYAAVKHIYELEKPTNLNQKTRFWGLNLHAQKDLRETQLSAIIFQRAPVFSSWGEYQLFNS